jgi:hypothetical protein
MLKEIVQYYIQEHGGTPNVIPPILMVGTMAITTRLNLHKYLSGAPGQLLKICSNGSSPIAILMIMY